MGGDDPGIGRNAVAGFQQQHVAGHEMRGLHQRGLAVAAHPGDGRQHVLQRRQRGLGPMFLEKAEQGVDEDDDGDDHGVLEIAHRARQHGRAEQDDDEKAPELVEKLEPDRARRRFGETVGAVALEAGLRLGDRQSRRRIDCQPTGDGFQGFRRARAGPRRRHWVRAGTKTLRFSLYAATG